MTVKIAVFGAGRIAQTHLASLTTSIPGARVELLVDVLPQVAAQTAARFGIARHGTEPHAALEDPGIDALVICSSTDTHARLIREAAQAGKHIFCEKPIDLDVARIDEALAEVKAAGVKLQVGFNRRFDSNNVRIRKAITSGEIGEPQILHISSRDPEPAPMAYTRHSGGIFVDSTVHDFDLARFLIGAEIVEVYAVGEVNIVPELRKLGDVDTSIVTMRFANGVLGTIDNSRQAVYGYDQRVEVFGSGGAARSGNRHLNEVSISDDQSVRRDLPHWFFMTRYTESFVAEMAAFVQAVIEDGPVAVDGFDGRMPVVLGKAAFLSLEQGRPIRLEEIDGAFYNPLR